MFEKAARKIVGDTRLQLLSPLHLHLFLHPHVKKLTSEVISVCAGGRVKHVVEAVAVELQDRGGRGVESHSGVPSLFISSPTTTDENKQNFVVKNYVFYRSDHA